MVGQVPALWAWECLEMTRLDYLLLHNSTKRVKTTRRSTHLYSSHGHHPPPEVLSQRTSLIGRAKQWIVVRRQRRWNKGGGAPRYWGLAYRQKGPARATKYFSGNGVAVASICAVLHKYRPVAANEGGLPGKVDISPEMGPTAHLWLTHGPLSQHRESPTSL